MWHSAWMEKLLGGTTALGLLSGTPGCFHCPECVSWPQANTDWPGAELCLCWALCGDFLWALPMILRVTERNKL